MLTIGKINATIYLATKREQKEVSWMDAKQIGAKLLSLRGKKTIEEVSSACGISKSALSMYENGQRIPRDEIKIKLAQYYNSTVELIFFI